MAKIYQHPQETWDEKKCQAVAKHRGRDGYGSLHPYKGLVSPVGSCYIQYGRTIKYNGGCLRNGEWYDGEEMPLPKIPKGWEFYTIPTWGIYLRKKS
jgi:hypothetical protein